MRVLVTGGAGYIGSVVVDALVERGDEVVVVDSLCEGNREAVAGSAQLEVADIRDAGAMDRVFSALRPQAVIHLAALAVVPESLTNPAAYYDVNVRGTLVLLDAMVRHGVPRIVFSSTCAVYGEPALVPIADDTPTAPINPYGETKLAAERALHWYGTAHGIGHVSLRYFNAAGATPLRGECRRHETHLIPLALQAARTGRPLRLHGQDYPTPDGTCVRDYIHVADIAAAHLAVLERIGTLPRTSYNVGAGVGISNQQVIRAVERITGQPVPVVAAERRPGDPAVLTADASAFVGQVGWAPRSSALDQIVAGAWDWQRQHPHGYAGDPGTGQSPESLRDPASSTALS
jgi:UDP-glucose 4-epimerase